MLAPAAPRWPSVRAGRGHYESYYLRAVDPERRRGVWLRYTVAVPPAGGRPSGRLWFTLFDRTRPAPRAMRTVVDDVGTDPATLVRLGESTFAEGAATGTMSSDDGSARWRLRWTGTEPALLHLPRAVYGTRLPRTKLLSLTPSAAFDGEVEVDGDRIPVSGWPGMAGHNWGEEHAPQWIWVHGVGFSGAGPDTWLDLALARIRIGALLTPWTAFGAVSVAGRRLSLGGPGRRVVVDEEPGRCRLRIGGRGLRVTAEVSAPPEAFVTWDYPNPSGPSRAVVNCSVADLSVRIDRAGRAPERLVAQATGVFERGREPSDGT